MKIRGRKSYAEARPEVVAMAKRLHRYPANGRRRSLRDVAEELAKAGYVTKTRSPTQQQPSER